MAQRLTGFDEILEQQSAIDWLRSAWKRERLPHGLIFAGPAGVGKATTARALATLFLCDKPTDARPCGECPSCVAMSADVHPDFHLVYRQLRRLEKESVKARELAVDVIRQFLIAPANLKSTMGRGKVFLVEEADLMSTTAQNALLKTLEEPAGRTVIILLTDQPDALLPTIRSRCQVLRFALLDEKLVQTELHKRGHDKTAASAAARLAEGSLGVALRWLQDGVVDRARQLVAQLDGIIAAKSGDDLPHWFKEASDSYAEKQLERDPLASKDQATREGVATYLRIASNHLRRRLTQLEDPDQIERACDAIDELAGAEQFLDANVNIPLVVQNMVLKLQDAFAATA